MVGDQIPNADRQECPIEGRCRIGPVSVGWAGADDSGTCLEDPVRLRLLGTVPYGEGRLLQQRFAESPFDYVLVLEHPTTITLGRRADPAHVLIDPTLIGAELFEADRGGDVTLHGPGQLVGYAIVTLHGYPRTVSTHVDRLEDALIETVRSFVDESSIGVVGRLEGHRGVWVGVEGTNPAKIAALGVRVQRIEGRRRTLHGVALNVDVDLSLFDAIVPCGLAGRPVTSLKALGVDVPLQEIEERLSGCLVEALFPGRAVERASVREQERTASGSRPHESMLYRRLRTAGVDPGQGIELVQRKPPWLRVPIRLEQGFQSTKSVVDELGLVTVCKEAGCPNIFECWADGTATFMVNGERCTRACGFCLVDTRKPLPLEADEPERVAMAVERMELSHAVITCVARDDLKDGGAGAIAQTIEAVRRRCPKTSVEVLISDLKGCQESLALILDARPDVLNHNVETVPRLQRAVRPSAGYARSLAVLGRAVEAGLVVKSGMMLGLGETDDEVLAVLADLAAIGVQLVTIGQYLRPSSTHLPVARYASPEVFDLLAARGRALGLAHVQASPLTRSSYHAREAAASASHPVPLAMPTAR
jgi:lipoic acid synthetase